MSGPMFVPAPPPPEHERRQDELFRDLVVSNPHKPRGRFGWSASVVSHTVLGLLLVLVPLFWPGPLPEQPDYIRALIWDPPPPPPPPLPKGSALVPDIKPAKPVTPEPRPEPTPQPEMVAEIDVPEPVEVLPEPEDAESVQMGSLTGSEFGVAEGMEGGALGGQVGGVPGGVLGGVVGGTGTGPVMDYDRPPRPIKITQPRYPQEAFVKKVEGTVLVEILIDSEGRVIKARVVQSIPLLDTAALETVYQWRFSPAMKNGRAVATVANAPVRFRIY